MNKLRTIEGGIIIALVIALYFLAKKYSLYFIFPGIDWVQHFMGGIGIALVVSGLITRNLKVILSVTLGMALGWEVFERIGHIYLPMYINYGGTGDTLMDIFCAIMGTSLVLLATRE